MSRPLANIALARNIIDSGGALVSEYPPGTPSYRSNFPVRNRIIAGLSVATIIIEASKKSGTLLTARACLEYNREVLAIPHNWYVEGGEGPNQLIRIGATLITNVNDVLEVIGFDVKHTPTLLRTDSLEEKIILECLKREPLHIDTITLSTKLSPSKVNSTISLMEMKRLVRHVGGNLYIKGY